MRRVERRRVSGWCLAVASGLLLGGPLRAESGADLLRGLLPGDEEVAALNALVDQLGADRFKDREAASSALRAAPVVPEAVYRRGLESGDPEIVARIREIRKSGGGERVEQGFARALRLIAEGKEAGQLGAILRVLDSGVAKGDPGWLERAAAVTAQEGDEATVAGLAESEEESRRRIAAGAAQGVGAAGTELGEGLLKDESAAVRLRAAITLGNRGEATGAKALGGFLASEDTIERARAWKALRGLTGKNFGFGPLKQAAERADAAEAWQRWLADGSPEIVGQAGELSWTRLFDGRSLEGWTQFRGGRALAPDARDWKVEDGVLICPGNGPGDLRSAAAYAEYILIVEFRPPERGADSGLGVMLTAKGEQPGGNLRRDGGDYLEVQLLPNRSGDLYVIGDFKAQAGGANIAFSHPRHADVGDDVGQWHEARLEVGGGEAAVFINGVEVNRAEGGPKEPGKILLREERSRFEFREISLLPLAELKLEAAP